MAGYGTVIAFAEELGETEHVELLNETLEEERQTDQKLTDLAGEKIADYRSQRIGEVIKLSLTATPPTQK